MLLLAIDTSGRQGSIALASVENRLSQDLEVLEIAELTGGTFSAQLIPQIDSLVSRSGFTKFDIDAFAVNSGPGSFTGLRVGLAAVKALAEVLLKPIATVSGLEALAFVSGKEGLITAVIDAGRGEVYVGEYEMPKGKSLREQLMSRAEFLELAKGRTVVTADSPICEALKKDGVSADILPPISADAVARLGWNKIRSGITVSSDQLEANYIRRTDAEILEKSRS